MVLPALVDPVGEMQIYAPTYGGIARKLRGLRLDQWNNDIQDEETATVLRNYIWKEHKMVVVIQCKPCRPFSREVETA